MKCNISFFCFLCFVAHVSYGFTGKYPIQNFTPSDYQAGIQNIDFAQNRDMTLFVANNFGVLAYNGNSWELHHSRTGKKERSLVFEEKTNRLYVGSQGSFGYFEEEWNYISLMDKIPQNAQDFDEVWDVFLFNSNVYFCTFKGIYVYNGQSITLINYEGGFNRTFQSNGKLFVQSQDGELFEIKAANLSPVHLPIKSNRVIAGVISQNEGLLVFYNSGKVDFLTSFGVREPHLRLIQTLQGKYVNHVLQLSDTRLAISTQTAGLFIYDLQTQSIENISVTDGLLTNACLRTFQDYSGNLWVGMQNGIGLIDLSSPMRFLNEEISIEGSGYEAFEVEEGTYYTTLNGIYYLEKNASRSIFLAGTEGPAYGLQKINGKLYAGHHTGLLLLEKGKAQLIAKTHGLWQIKQLQSNPQFAIAGTYSGLYLFKMDQNMTLQPVQAIEGFDESSRFFEEDQKGRIWVGQFYKGLYRLNLNEDMSRAEVKKISDDYPDLPIGNQITLSRIDNELYLATTKGVYQLDQTSGRIEKSELFAKDIGDQPVYLLVQDHKKNIHIITENQVGFYKQISSNHHTFIASSLFQLRYSFNNDLLNVSINTENGVLFNANEGFINYKPELEKRIRLEDFLIINKVFSVTEDSVLYARQPFEMKPSSIESMTASHRAKVLQFEVESFQFNEMNNQQFRYWLKGFDEGYGEWTNVPLKEYTNLKEGEYEFYVQTRNYFGEIVTSLPLPLTVEPPFYRTLLARLFYIVLGALALFGISRIQKRRYVKKTEEVKESKQLELEKKEQELIKIEKQKERELRQLEDDKVKSEMQHLNKLLAASTMNLVVKNEFMENVKEKLKEVKQMGKNKETKQSLEQIVKDIDTTLRLQEDWRQFEYHFDQVHGDFLTRLRSDFLNLSPNEQRLCAFLRLNLNTKDIANIMGVSSRGVEVARYRLRKKLELDKGQNLTKFLLEY